MDVEDDNMGDEWVERVKEYFVVCTHAILCARGIYPSYIFEQQRYLGITVWKSRHPEVNDYVQRVIDNAHSMLENNLIDRLVIVLETKDGNPLDHIIIKCIKPVSPKITEEEELSDNQRTVIEEEFRSTILRIGMLDQQMMKAPDDSTWKIMVVTKTPEDSSDRQIMQSSLTNGQWFVDNNKLPEQASLSHRVRKDILDFPFLSLEVALIRMCASLYLISIRLQVNHGSVPRLLPIKSYRDESLIMSVRTLQSELFASITSFC